MRCQGGNSGTGYEDGQYPFVLYNCAVVTHKTTKLLILVFPFDLNKLNDPIFGDLYLVRSKSRVFKDIHNMHGQILYGVRLSV